MNRMYQMDKRENYEEKVVYDKSFILQERKCWGIGEQYEIIYRNIYIYEL